MHNETVWLRIAQFSRLLFVMAVIALLVLSVIFLTPLLYPFLIGLIIALLINRPVNWLERKGKMPRWLAVTISLLLFLTVFLTLISVLVAEIIIEISRLITILPSYIEDLKNYFQTFITQELIRNWYEQLSSLYYNLDIGYQQQIEENISLGLNKIAQAGRALIQSILLGIKNFLASFPNAATVFVISILAAFFISKDFYKIKARARTWLPLKVHSRIRAVVLDLQRALIGFCKAQLTLISITAVIVTVGLIILRVEYAVTIGFITGLVDLLPYLGTGAVFVPWIVYLFFTGQYSLVIGLSVLYAVIIVFRQIMEPKILATNVGLDPLVTLIALFVGLKLFGFLGLILGPASVVILMALHRANVFQDVWLYIKTGESQ
ncbi:sporulation integral membrane protein YtvI [Bacillaceae bacterium]